MSSKSKRMKDAKTEKGTPLGAALSFALTPVKKEIRKKANKMQMGVEQDLGRRLNKKEERDVLRTAAKDVVKKAVLFTSFSLAAVFGGPKNSNVAPLLVQGSEITAEASDNRVIDDIEKTTEVKDVLITAGAVKALEESGHEKYINKLKNKETLKGTEEVKIEKDQNQISDEIIKEVLKAYNEKYNTEYTFENTKYFRSSNTNFFAIDKNGNYLYDYKEEWPVEEYTVGGNAVHLIYDGNVIFSLGDTGSKIVPMNTREVRGNSGIYPNVRRNEPENFLNANDINISQELLQDNNSLKAIYDAISNEVDRAVEKSTKEQEER